MFLILAGIAMLIGCILMFVQAWQLRHERDREFVVSLLIGILILVLGIVMIINLATVFMKQDGTN